MRDAVSGMRYPVSDMRYAVPAFRNPHPDRDPKGLGPRALAC